MNGVHDTGVLRAHYFSPVITASTEALSPVASVVTVRKGSGAGSCGGGADSGGDGSGNKPTMARGC